MNRTKFGIATLTLILLASVLLLFSDGEFLAHWCIATIYSCIIVSFFTLMHSLVTGMVNESSFLGNKSVIILSLCVLLGLFIVSYHNTTGLAPNPTNKEHITTKP